MSGTGVVAEGVVFTDGAVALRVEVFADALLEGGRRPDTPVAMIENGSLPTQRLLRTDLAHAGEVAEAEGLRPPAIVVIGDVAATRIMESRMDPVAAEPLHHGTPGKLMRWAERLAIAGGVGALLTGGRRGRVRRGLAALSGGALVAASACTRFGVFEAGLESAKDNGLLAGFPLIDFKATLTDGKFHDVDSSVLAFEIAARAAFRELKEKGSPKLLEPIMAEEVVTPEDYMGDVMGDLNRRRGMIQGQDMRGNATVVNAFVPLANMFGYINNLRSMSSGRAVFTMQFDHYDAVPQNISDEIQKKYA